MKELSLRGAPVVDEHGHLVGVAEIDRLTECEEDGDRRVQSAIDRDYPRERIDVTLDVAVDLLVSTSTAWLPVIDDGRRLVGILAMTDIIRGYRSALRRNLRLLSTVPRGTVLVQEMICDSSAFAGQTVADAPWPHGAVAISVERGSHLIFPEPETRLAAGDILSIVAPRGVEETLRRSVAGGA